MRNLLTCNIIKKKNSALPSQAATRSESEFLSTIASGSDPSESLQLISLELRSSIERSSFAGESSSSVGVLESITIDGEGHGEDIS